MGDHLDNKLSKMLEEISEEKELNVIKNEELIEEELEEELFAVEHQVAAEIDAVMERVKATEGWDVTDEVSKVDVVVNGILDEHGIEGAEKEHVMDHLDNKLFKMLEEISEEKELDVIKNEEQVEEELEEEIEAKHNVKAMKVSEAGK